MFRSTCIGFLFKRRSQEDQIIRPITKLVYTHARARAHSHTHIFQYLIFRIYHNALNTLILVTPAQSKTSLRLLRKALSHDAINVRRLLVHKLPDMYAFVQLSDLEQRRRNEIAEGLKQLRGSRTGVLSIEKPMVYLLRHRTPVTHGMTPRG